MTKVRQIIVYGIVLLMSCTLSSCKEDPYVVISAVVSCSPDLLDFVTPTVTITGDNGETQSLVLTPADFKESEKGGSIVISISINGQTSASSSSIKNYIATCDKRFDGESASGNITVTYTLKDNYTINREKYVFFHGVGYDCRTVYDKGVSIDDVGNYIKPAAYEVDKDEVEEYLHNLITQTDTDHFKINVK